MNILKHPVFIPLCFCLVLYNCKRDSKQNVIADVKKETLFKSVSPNETGITFNNKITEDQNNFFLVYNYAYNGGGVAIGDINNDGLADIFFTGNQVSNKLYLNKGNFKFEDITNSAGIKHVSGWNNGVVMADVNGDGYLDIYICKGGWKGSNSERANLLYINNKNNTFSEQAAAFNINDVGFSMMASFFDMDNDNDLDMYLINRPRKFYLSYDEIKKGKQEQNPLYRDKLFENVNGTYREIGQSSGINQTFAYGLGLSTSDLNNDGFSDIYVANDYFESDYFFKNTGNKTFHQDLQSLTNHVAFYGMGVDVVDFNNDGFEDIVELDMTPSDYVRSKTTMASMNVEGYYNILKQGNHYQYMHNMLQINNGNGFFSEISQLAGVDKTDWSWSCIGSDFDNDGLRDLFISNGYRRDIFNKDATKTFSEYVTSDLKKKRSKKENVDHIVNLFNENKISNYIYKNNGNLKFTNKAKDWGLDAISFSNGAAVGDLDNDGDLDLVVNNINDIAFVYKNTTEQTGHNYINIKLNGPDKNTSGLGAKITLYTKDSIQYHELKNVRGYLSSVNPIAHFGLATIQTIDSIKVVWPDKKTSFLTDIQSNQLLHIDYDKAISIQSKKIVSNPLFKNITNTSFSNKPFKHQENDFNDFEKQILLPHKLSTEGPCITVADINNDGYEDFFVGGAANQSGEIYIQKPNNTFLKTNQKILSIDKSKEDTAALFFDANGDGFTDLYVASGGNEFEEGSTQYQDRLYLNNGKGHFITSGKLPKINSSTSCIVPLDYDNDGDLDLFIGGRLTPNKYPNAPKSFILQNNSGAFIDVTKKIAKELEHIGMVTDALWIDTNGDAKNELIIVGEWMPITIFNFKNGAFRQNTTSNLEATNGWWNTIKTKDLDLDGDLDFVVGNLGENYKFKASKDNPFYVFASDYDSNGTNDVFLAKNYKNKIVPVRGKECSTEQLPGLSKKFKTYNAFANAGLGVILNDENLESQKHHAYIFQTLFLINNNGKFQTKALPAEAQYSTVQDLIIDDFDADGIDDIIIAGNKFNVEIETTRADASIGLFLKGEGNFNFTPLKPLSSGVFIPENIKTLSSIQLDDNAKGLLLGINNKPIQLLKN